MSTGSRKAVTLLLGGAGSYITDYSILKQDAVWSSQQSIKSDDYK